MMLSLEKIETIINYRTGWFYRKCCPIYGTETKLAFAFLIDTDSHLNGEYSRKFNHRNYRKN